MFKLATKNCTLTEAMKNAIEDHFSFLQMGDDSVFRFTLERLNSHTLKLNVCYQEPHLTLIKIQIIDEDFYVGLDQCAKKLKLQVVKQRQKRYRNQDKQSLGESFVMPFDLSPLDDKIKEPLISSELTIPIYVMNLDEALEQIETLNYNVMLFKTDEEGIIHTLVRQSDNSLKHYIGIEN